MKLLLIIGGQSTEHFISRKSATNIANAINRNKYDFKVLGITQNGEWCEISDNIIDYSSDKWLNNSKKINNNLEYLKMFDVVFPILHGMYGEDGTIQGILELANVPYVGCKVLDSAIAMDKVITKRIISTTDINQVPFVYVKKKKHDFVIVNDDTSETHNIVDHIETYIGFPCFIKASRSGSSVGCYKVYDKSQVLQFLDKASKYDNKILVEKAINAIELECAILGNDDVIVSKVGQILPHGDFYSYESKYEDVESATLIPAKINNEISEYIRQSAAKIFKTIAGHGLARCDFFLDKETNDVYFNEINTMPGFTNISMYPELMKNFGISLQKLIDKLIELAIEK